MNGKGTPNGRTQGSVRKYDPQLRDVERELIYSQEVNAACVDFLRKRGLLFPGEGVKFGRTPRKDEDPSENPTE